MDAQKLSGAVTGLSVDLGDGGTAFLTLPTASVERLTVTRVVGASGAFLDLVANGAGSFYLSNIQLETGSTATAYQRVTDQYNVTEAGVSSVSYLFFDGVNDSLATPTITPGVDKAQIFAGVRKLSAAAGMIAEVSVNANTTNGAWRLTPGNTESGSGAFYSAASRGTALADADSAGTFAAPITNVVSFIGEIAADICRLRINGTQAAQSTGDQGTGNYLAYPLYIGARAGTSFFFSGHLYSLIARFGPNLDTGQISSTETWVASRTGIVI
jgi:hypothetical protein